MRTESDPSKLQAMAPYLIGGPHSNMVGLYDLQLSYAQGDLGWSIKAVEKAIARLQELRFCFYLPDEERILVYGAWAHELGREGMKPDDNRRYQLAKLLAPMILSPLFAAFLHLYPQTRQALIGLLPVAGIAPPPSPLLEALPPAPLAEEAEGHVRVGAPAHARAFAEQGAGNREQGTEGSGVGAEPLRTAGSGPNDERVILVFPTVGRGEKSWTLHEGKLLEYQADYPNLDVLGAFRKAHNWCVNNPAKRKTARGMSAFLTNWLNNETDRYGRSPVAAARPQLRIAARRADAGEQAETGVQVPKGWNG